MNKNLAILGLLCVACSGVLPAHVTVEKLKDALSTEVDKIEAEAEKAKLSAASMAFSSTEPALCITGGRDTELALSGTFRVDAVGLRNTETYNDASGLDRSSALNGRLELGGAFTYGKKKYGKAAVELAAKLRHQHQAGRFDKVLVTKGSSAKVGTAVVEVAPSSINATVPWIKETALKVYVNALMDRDISTDHFVKIGLFHYMLGRGITYGDSYGTPKDYLGLYSASHNFAPFGVLFSGDMIKNRLSYDLYFARMEEKSGDFKQTSAITKKHIVDNRTNGAAGPGISNDVFAVSVNGHYDNARFGDIKTTSYIMYNNARDTKIEMINDSESKLISIGTGFEYEKGNFEFGGEVAFNTGTEYVYNIDRNVIQLKGMYPLAEQSAVYSYSHVTLGSETDTARDGSSAPVVSTIKSAIDGYDSNINSATIASGLESTSLTSEVDDYTVANTSNRYRPAYRNQFAGWMAVVDGSYNWKPANMKFSVAAGHASGDANPHNIERDKTYYGFVGVNENYAGKRVQSLFALSARKLQTPLIVDPNQQQLFDNSFTDLTFVGSGIEWRATKRDLKCNTNALVFFKDARNWKYIYNPVSNNGQFSSSEYASRYLGVEFNASFDWKLLPGLSLLGEVAVFMPGTFYTDSYGLPMDSSVIAVLDDLDSTGRTAVAQRLGSDVPVAANLALQYKF